MLFGNYVVVTCPECKGQGYTPAYFDGEEGYVTCKVCKGYCYVRVNENKLEIYGEDEDEFPSGI